MLLPAYQTSRCPAQGTRSRPGPVRTLWGSHSMSARSKNSHRATTAARGNTTRIPCTCSHLTPAQQKQQTFSPCPRDVTDFQSKAASHLTLTTPAGSQLAGRTDDHLQTDVIVCHPVHYARAHTRTHGTFHVVLTVKVKVKLTLIQAIKSQRGNRGIAPLVL